jgi:uncharacterized protein (TIGR00369 family)
MAAMTAETGTVMDRFERPPCADLLGWRMLEAKPEVGWVKVAFEGRPEFRNPAGFVQGGFLSAMLDDVMGPAVLLMTGGATYTVTIDLHVSFLAPAKPGPIVGEGRVVQLGKSIGFVEGSLRDAAGALLARATSTVRLIPAEKALA